MKQMKTIALLCLAAILLWAGGYVVFCLYTLSLKPQQPERITDSVIVLTGGRNRIEEGLRLFAEGRARHLFITGVYPDVKESDITQMWEGETALPPCCISLDHNAVSTVQNAKETYRWIKDYKYTTVRLVTANYHMPRALGEFHKYLPGITIIPHPIMQPGFEAFTDKFYDFTFKEYHKFLVRWVQLLFTFPPKE